MMRRHLKTLLTLTLLAALLASCLPAALMEGAAGGAVQLDLDPEGGYAGDYVVIINGNLGAKDYLSTGMIGDQVEKDIRPLKLPHPNFKDMSVYNAPQKGSPDPFLPEDDSLKQEAMADLQEGHLKVFRMDDESSPGGQQNPVQAAACGHTLPGVDARQPGLSSLGQPGPGLCRGDRPGV